jgi:hypothetical protein
MVEIKGIKTGHFLEMKTAPLGLLTAGAECPKSEPAKDDIQFSRSRMGLTVELQTTWALKSAA